MQKGSPSLLSVEVGRQQFHRFTETGGTPNGVYRGCGSASVCEACVRSAYTARTDTLRKLTIEMLNTKIRLYPEK